MDGRSSDNSSVRKRGHQHHIRFEGTRRSNIPADEIIAALRAGDDCSTLMQTSTAASNNDNIEQTNRSDMKMHLAVDNNKYNIYFINNGDDSDEDDEVAMLDGDDNRNNNNSNRPTFPLNMSIRYPDSNALVASSNEWLNETSISSSSATATATSSTSTLSSSELCTNNNNNSKVTSSHPRESALTEMGRMATKDYEPDLTDSVNSGSSTSIKKSKSKRDGNSKKNNIKSCEPNIVSTRKDKRKRTKVSQASPTEERPPLEGAAATDQWNEFDMADIENDPEVAEWSKLRCTSERTEVVAEREYRRQNRRCADYPGLAFGRSIFSSDTMMKLNIIRNELHNIMKTQLKRVRNTTKRVYDGTDRLTI